MLDESICESCGWAAAIISMLSFGSFGVPIKSDAAKSVNIDPLVFQSYKSFMCFATSWFVLLLKNQTFTFTPWGIVSGLFWVPGGVATVYAVKNAGLAVGIGVGSSCIVLVSFIWGIFVFDEPVRSKVGVSFAILFMVIGLMGMAYYSSPEGAINDQSFQSPAVAITSSSSVITFASGTEAGDFQDNSNAAVANNNHSYEVIRTGTNGEDQELSSSFEQGEDGFSINDTDSTPDNVNHYKHAIIYGWKISKRKLGLLVAVFGGVWGGSILVPMHWSSGKGTKGIGYTVSFAIGESIITILLWVGRLLFEILRRCYYESERDTLQSRSSMLSSSWNALPSFHIRKMWLPGMLSGLLWSIGNFNSMISVEMLGEGVGYSVVQAAMLVSGLWGIFYFKEILNVRTIMKWFASALLTVCGILLLGHEHHVPS